MSMVNKVKEIKPTRLHFVFDKHLSLYTLEMQKLILRMSDLGNSVHMPP